MQLVTSITYLKEALESIEDSSKKVKYYDGAANV